MCTDPSTQCGCNDNPSSIEADAREFATRAAGSTCHQSMCPEGSTPRPSGFVCSCDDGESDGSPRPRPMPFSLMFLGEAGALVGTDLHEQMNAEDPLSLMMMDALRP